MRERTPGQDLISGNPFLAVQVGAAEARRLNEALQQIGGRGYQNPVTLAMERLRAGLLTFPPEEDRPAAPEPIENPPARVADPQAGPAESAEPQRELVDACPSG